jgi:hypothetical protein
VAHSLAYAVFARQAERDHAEAYWQYAPMLAAPCLVLVLLALVACALEARRRVSAARPAAWPFFVAPPAIFTLQEHLERLGQNIWHDRPFLAGLALQALLGLVAWLVARLLLGVATIVGRTFRDVCSRHRQPSVLRPRPSVALPPLPALATGHAQRGPPALFFG